MKKILIITCIMLFGLSIKAQWIKIGNSINGEAADDRFGRSVSLSNDGNVVAIASVFNDNNENNAGQVKVYELESGDWIQKGNSILGSNAGDLLGQSIGLSNDGNILAIGSPYHDNVANNSGKVEIFTFEGNDWVLLGNMLTGNGENDLFGISLSLSGDASTICIGSTNNDNNEQNVGQLSTYRFANNSWSLLGSSINGTSSENLMGISTAINFDGSIICAGAIFNDEAAEDAGKLSVFELINNNWILKGNAVFGNVSDQLGSSVSLNEAGNIVAVGATEKTNSKGQVRVFQFQNNDWVQKGNNINGINDSDRLGVSLSLNSSGLVIAIGADENDDNGTDSGHVRIFEYNGNRWIQLEEDIQGESAGDLAGISTSLSGDGYSVAIGSTQSDENGNDSGQCRIFKLSNVGLSEIDLPASVYPNPTNRYLHIDSKEFIYASIYNLEGINLSNYELRENKYTIDLVEFKTGIYILKLHTKENKFQSKTIILK